MEFHIAEIDLSCDPTAPPSSVWQGLNDLACEDNLARFGYTDLVDTNAVARLERLRNDTDALHLPYVVIAGPVPDGDGLQRIPATGDTSVAPADVLAEMWVDIPILDNDHLGYVYVSVRPNSRGHGIGSTLLRLGEQELRAHDRTTALCWSTVTSALTDPGAAAETTLVDPTGTIGITTTDAEVAFAVNHGFSFSQAERHSVQPLPVPADVLTDALAEGEAKAAGYELVQFLGEPSDDLLEGLAPLFAGMATDSPWGDVDWRPEIWDAERVKRTYTVMCVGRDVYTTCARHIESGELAAFTQLKVPHGKPDAVFQENTLVLRQHRGHALGLWIKAANCAWVSRESPTSERVHTWNADENDFMLAINTRLGYRRESIGAAWQKVLS